MNRPSGVGSKPPGSQPVSPDTTQHTKKSGPAKPKSSPKTTQRIISNASTGVTIGGAAVEYLQQGVRFGKMGINWWKGVHARTAQKMFDRAARSRFFILRRFQAISGKRLLQDAQLLSARAGKWAQLSHSLDRLNGRLNVLSAGLSGLVQASTSPATTPFGKLVDGLASGAFFFVLGKGGVKGGSPIAPALSVMWGLDALYNKGRISNFYAGAIHGGIVLGEAGALYIFGKKGKSNVGLMKMDKQLAQGKYGGTLQLANAIGKYVVDPTLKSSKRLENYHKAALKGKYGIIHQTIAEAGKFYEPYLYKAFVATHKAGKWIVNTGKSALSGALQFVFGKKFLQHH